MFNFSYRFGPNVFEFINRSRPTNLICFSHRSRSTTEQDLCIFASAYRSAGEIHFKNNYVYVDLKSDLHGFTMTILIHTSWKWHSFQYESVEAKSRRFQICTYVIIIGWAEGEVETSLFPARYVSESARSYNWRQGDQKTEGWGAVKRAVRHDWPHQHRRSWCGHALAAQRRYVASWTVESERCTRVF